MYFGCKSDLLSCFDSLCPAADVTPSVDAMVFDGAVIVNMLRPSSGARTFDDYADKTCIPPIMSHMSHDSCAED